MKPEQDVREQHELFKTQRYANPMELTPREKLRKHLESGAKKKEGENLESPTQSDSDMDNCHQGNNSIEEA